MSSSGNDFFSNVRSKWRQSRSSFRLSATSSTTNLTTSRPDLELWEGIPVEYHPVERAASRPPSGHYGTYRPLPGPPPRPRTTSPASKFRPILRIDTGNEPYIKRKEYRRRSDQYFSAAVQEQNSQLHYHDQQVQDRRRSLSVEIAAALPPEHLDPPPPYSPHLGPSRQYSHNQIRPHSYHADQEFPVLRPYDPQDYVSTTSLSHSTHHPSDVRRASMEIPTIEAQEPTPVSPMNSLDQQYLELRSRGPSVTIDSLLAHPMLQR
ncbi:hypothetical protein PV08_05557 [Exophiala spinifera]|uniref:Uncharacterized protein n=1 Tax=Exophiala spinifera TaxID=91928 RepID=A0A0D1YKM3_9EURO|nr:uncharacterized protein PV08_05557 [Exophiala spinifera]KIW15511.1 hypothetical protein PV08_05557 [Exophiala spinifera]